MIPLRILVVEDHEPFARLICSMLEQMSDLQVVGQASDGLQAVQIAEELQPDLIVLDIGLPTLNGMEVARQLRKLAPETKVLFLSQESSSDVVLDALKLGALGYVHKLRAQNELLPAIEAVLGGKQFVSSNLKDWESTDSEAAPTPHRHEVQFYSDDTVFLDSFATFIVSALEAGNAVIVVVTEPHRDSLLLKLRAHGFDVAAAIGEGRYISMDAAATIETFMVNGQIDEVRFSQVVRDLIVSAAKAAKGDRPRVAACGECAHLLWAQGKVEAAIRDEQLWDEIAKTCDVDILCAYPLDSFHREDDSHIFKSICAEHSAVHT
jgi:DNA-binding NarL/FixJ family response regulator